MSNEIYQLPYKESKNQINMIKADPRYESTLTDIYAELEDRAEVDIPSEVFWIRTRAETLDLNVLFRALFEKTVTNDALTFREFLYALAFLHVNL